MTLSVRRAPFSSRGGPLDVVWFGFFHSFTLYTKSHSHTEAFLEKCEEFCIFHTKRKIHVSPQLNTVADYACTV